MGNLCNAQKKQSLQPGRRHRQSAPSSEAVHAIEPASFEREGLLDGAVEQPSVQEDNVVDFTLQIPAQHLSRLNRDNLNLTSKLDDLGTMSVSLLQLKQYAQDDEEMLRLLRNLGFNGLDPKTKINIAFRPAEEPSKDAISHYVRAQLRKAAQPEREGEEAASLRILDTLFHLERVVPQEHLAFLAASSEVNALGYHCPVWDPEVHELSFSGEQLGGVLGEEAVLHQLEACAQEANCRYAPRPEPSECTLFDVERRNLADFDVAAFDSSNLLALVLSLVNYDATHGTPIVRRLLYPHADALPACNALNLHLVKLHVNGCKRAFAVQSDFARAFTRQREHFPALFARALAALYPHLDSAPIAELVYRCVSWIPEKLLLSEAGDIHSSFQRLRESFSEGNFLLFVNDRTSGKVRPVLDMRYEGEERPGGELIVTTASSGIKLIGWGDLLSICNTDYIFINWNPTIYDYRKHVHFKALAAVPPPRDPDFAPFATHHRSQLLLSLQPHARETEVRILIEKHRRPRSTPYNISYTLTPYEESRVSLLKHNLRTITVTEPGEEILADLIIFEKNDAVQHFVLVVALEAVDAQAAQRLPRGHCERLSLTVFSFVDFELIEMPFRGVAQSLATELPFRPDAARLDSRASISSFSSPFVATFPCLRLQVGATALCELRLVGLPTYTYSLYLFKAQGFAPSLANAHALRRAEGLRGCNCLTAKLEPNTYFVRVVVQAGSGPIDESVYALTPHSLKLHILGFGRQLLKSWDAAPGPAAELFRIEACDLANSVLSHRQRLEGVWTPQTNCGTARAPAPTYQRFHKNPGLIIALAEETELACRLSCSWDRALPAAFSLCVLEILADYSFRPLIEDAEYAAVEEIVTETLVLKPNANGFMVLALNSSPTPASFALELTANRPLAHVRDNRILAPNFKHIEKFFAAAAPGGGGSLDSPFFLLNAAVLVQFEGESEADFLALLRFESAEPVNLYLLPAARPSLVELTDEELHAALSTPQPLIETHSLFAQVRPGGYFLVPSPAKPLAKGANYELALHCAAPMRFMRAQPFTACPALTSTLYKCSRGGVQLRVRERGRLLVDIAADRRTVKLEVALQRDGRAQPLPNGSGNDHHFRGVVELQAPGEAALVFRDLWDMNSNFHVTLFPTVPNYVIIF